LCTDVHANSPGCIAVGLKGPCMHTMYYLPQSPPIEQGACLMSEGLWMLSGASTLLAKAKLIGCKGWPHACSSLWGTCLSSEEVHAVQVSCMYMYLF